MGRRDWSRKTTWSPADQEDFFAHLRRVRQPGHRASHLLTQAVTLLQADRERYATSALDLVETVLREPRLPIYLAQAHKVRGECLRALGRIPDALQAFREALAAEREFPQVRTEAWLEFGWTAVEHTSGALDDEAAAILAEFAPSPLLLAVHRYGYSAILALIADRRGDHQAAQEHAARALEAAALRHSGLRYHPDVGLVTQTRLPLHARLERLAHRPSGPVH